MTYRFLTRLESKIREAIECAKREGDMIAYASESYNDAEVEISVDYCGNVNIAFMHYEDGYKQYSNLREAIEAVVPAWDDVEIEEEDEWNEHGFANESDYNIWRYGSSRYL
jgi:hypothetical protein